MRFLQCAAISPEGLMSSCHLAQAPPHTSSPSIYAGECAARSCTVHVRVHMRVHLHMHVHMHVCMHVHVHMRRWVCCMLRSLLHARVHA